MEWNHVPLALSPSLRSQARGVCDRGTEWGYCSMPKLPHQSKLLFSILLTPYFVFRFGFLSETRQLWKLTHILFCWWFSPTSTYSGSVCPVFAWLNTIPGKMSFWASMKSVTCLWLYEEGLKLLFQGFDMSACVHLAWCQDALCQKVPLDLGVQYFPCSY